MPDVLDAEANKQRSNRGKRWKIWGESWGGKRVKSGGKALVGKNKQDMGGLRYVRVGVLRGVLFVSAFVFVFECVCWCAGHTLHYTAVFATVKGSTAIGSRRTSNCSCKEADG